MIGIVLSILLLPVKLITWLLKLVISSIIIGIISSSVFLAIVGFVIYAYLPA